MKVKNIFIGTILTALVLTSCDVLDQKYYMGSSSEQIFVSLANIESASYGLYDALQNAEFLGGRAQIYVDVRSNDVNPPTFFGNLSIFSPTAADGTCANAWQGAYRTIAECNLFLEGIEKAKADGIINDQLYKIYEGDAKFVRGLVYFYALHFWGQMYVKDSENLGVPLVLKPFNGGTAFTDAINLPRASIQACYNLIVSDFKTALVLPEERDDDFGGIATATCGSANAMLSRVYLYKNQNDSAIYYANKVIDADFYSLVATPYNNFGSPDNSTENIFFVAHSASDNPNTNNAIGQHYGSSNRADITVNSTFVGLYSENDMRRAQYVEYVASRSSWFCYKYRLASRNWAPIIRYAEVLLNKAEALVKSTNTINADAIELLNEVRQRSEPDYEYLASDFSDANALLEEILTERRRELCFEGHGSFDLFRNGKGIPSGRGSASAPAMPFPDNYFALPIPSSDIEKAPVIKQNKGY